MSKYQDSLRQAQDTRENKYTLALKKRSFEETPGVQKQTVFTLEQTPKPKNRVLRGIFTFVICLIFVVNISIFFTLRTYASREKEIKPIKKSSQTNKPKAKIKKSPYNKTSR